VTSSTILTFHSLTAVKFPDVSRLSLQVVTLYLLTSFIQADSTRTGHIVLHTGSK